MVSSLVFTGELCSAKPSRFGRVGMKGVVVVLLCLSGYWYWRKPRQCPCPPQGETPGIPQAWAPTPRTIWAFPTAASTGTTPPQPGDFGMAFVLPSLHLGVFVLVSCPTCLPLICSMPSAFPPSPETTLCLSLPECGRPAQAPWASHSGWVLLMSSCPASIRSRSARGGCDSGGCPPSSR